LVLAKIFQYLVVHQKDNPQKPSHITLKNKKKAAIDSPRSALKRKNKVEEGGALGSRMKME
jgi:hypothetical protein